MKETYRKLKKYYSKKGIDEEELKKCIELNADLYTDNSPYDINFLGLDVSSKMVFIEFSKDLYINIIIFASLNYRFSLKDIIQLEEEILEGERDKKFVDIAIKMLKLNENLSDDVKLWVNLRL